VARTPDVWSPAPRPAAFRGGRPRRAGEPPDPAVECRSWSRTITSWKSGLSTCSSTSIPMAEPPGRCRLPSARRTRACVVRGRRIRGTQGSPPGLVSIDSCRLRDAMPRSASPLTVSTRWRSDRPSRSSSRPPGCRRGAAGPQELLERGPVDAGAAGGLGEPPVAAGTLKGIHLEVWLLVGGRDWGVAQQVAHPSTVADPVTAAVVRRWFRTWVLDAGSACWRELMTAVAEQSWSQWVVASLPHWQVSRRWRFWVPSWGPSVPT
jgi:hypothetical protein